jgi:hypothetical protein
MLINLIGQGKRPLGLSRRRLKDNTKTDHKPVGCDCVDLIHVAQNRVHDNDQLHDRLSVLIPLGS